MIQSPPFAASLGSTTHTNYTQLNPNLNNKIEKDANSSLGNNNKAN